MFSRSGPLAFLLSGSAAVVTGLILLALSDAGSVPVLTAVAVFLLVHFTLVFVGLKYYQRELEHIREVVNSSTDREITGDGPVGLISLASVSEEIRAFADSRQQEIDRLRKQEAFRKDFIADVSHELKTPIFAAQGFVHTLLDGAVKDKTVRKKFLKKAARSLDGLDVLVQDLLTLSQIETGQIKMRFDSIDLYALTEEVLEQFRGKSNKKDIALRIAGPVRRVTVYADGQRISQVMTNLISNAIKHSEEDGEVVVSFGVKKKWVVTRVADTGAGIPKEHLHRIFERFYRVDKSRSREKGGTGLGLAIVKHILDGHNSRAEVQSEPGKGSVFSFKLPRTGPEKNGNGEDNESAEG